jgi:hypothetical protein
LLHRWTDFLLERGDAGSLADLPDRQKDAAGGLLYPNCMANFRRLGIDRQDARPGRRTPAAPTEFIRRDRRAGYIEPTNFSSNIVCRTVSEVDWTR